MCAVLVHKGAQREQGAHLCALQLDIVSKEPCIPEPTEEFGSDWEQWAEEELVLHGVEGWCVGYSGCGAE